VYPTFKDVLFYLENYKATGREAQWMQSTLRAVAVLCFGETGNVLNTNPEVSIDKLLEMDVILELDVLTDSDKTFLVESLLLWIHHYRMQQGGREKFKHAIIVEETHHILLRRKQELSGNEAITDVLLREIRELGESVILLDQHPSLISLPALGNTYCTVAMNLKHKSDTDAVANCLLLHSLDKDFLGKIETGYGIVRLQGRGFTPFLVRFPLVRIKKGIVTDEILDEKMKAISQELGLVQTDIRRESGILTQGKLGKVKNVGIRSGDENSIVEGDSLEKFDGIRLSEGETLFLKDILKNPVATMIERYSSLSFSRRKGNAVKNDLLKKKLIETKKVRHNGSWVKLQSLTYNGKKVLRELGYNVIENDRGGGLEHEYWKSKIKKYFEEKGFHVVKEYPIGHGRTVDLLVERGDVKFPVEVETGNSDIRRNIEKCLEHGFSYVVVVPLRHSVYLECKELEKEYDPAKVKFLKLSVFERKLGEA
jgi:hypothetical protein